MEMERGGCVPDMGSCLEYRLNLLTYWGATGLRIELLLLTVLCCGRCAGDRGGGDDMEATGDASGDGDVEEDATGSRGT